ncbi:MAG TPA: hypothetical protein VM529_05635 [Gemmata sp.]|jgi:hypothetical protein|nr:hypothetical protein [Gemmata sp.]
MSMRRGLLGLAGLAAVAGLTAAQPPLGAVEGREPNPVARQFHAEDPPTLGYGVVAAAPAPRAAAGFDAQRLAVDFLSDLLPDQLTMPLGTVPVWD